jgi:uncharacterized Tic20 family protein
MNNLPIDKSVRNVAMWGTLSNLILLASIFSPILTVIPSIEPFVLSLFPTVIWRKDRRKHPFIDEALTKAINFTLSIGLYIFIVCIISTISLVVGYAHDNHGTPPNPDLDQNLRSMIKNICTIGFVGGRGACILLILVHACTIAFGSFQVARGKVYKYPCSIYFYKQLE